MKSYAKMTVKKTRKSVVIELTGSKSKIVFKLLPPDDPIQRKPDIRLAKEHLGWEPEIPIEEGLKQTITYFERLISFASHKFCPH